MATVAENGQFLESIIVRWPLDEAIVWIGKNMEPEDVFPVRALNEWAENNGWQEKE